ncbi:PREDICTED: calmodulin-like [Acropora digitifera]|uniref:calmodulin-like n=1 Tax=Acropora digitifera TaxID=70779 RepID=UPI00077A28AC|nr:PREDICTED: calmodulin-like [Acropora digitifera]
MNTLNVPLMFALDKIRSADRRVRLHIKKAEKDENDVSKRDRKKTAYRDAKTFTEEQLEEFRTAFCVFDRSGTGKISLSQVIELCRSLGYNLTAIDRDIIYTEFRLAGERRISFLNFISIIKNVTLSKQSNTDLFNAFEIFDGENTGFFKVAELEKALKEMPQGKQVNENEIADILAMADPDGDGQVNFQEFKKLVLPTFHQY